ncbi:MAG: tRNA lysidine(34) synthetase TilS [Nitrosomonas sp.]|nr:tRNA lysidine(34) synthetase TilS [Nitrosomonas sp.]
MGPSRKLKSNNITDLTKAVLKTYIKRNDHVFVALSGGMDSIVLLDLLNALSIPMQFNLSAIHVDHGISQNAAQWSKFCCNICRTLSIPITITHLKIRKERGISLEAAARFARYQVFKHLKAEYVVLGQHQDDQAETLLLQLLRGAGIRGLAAMPVARSQADNAPQILRPMLNIPRSSIKEYAQTKKLNWVNDESNENITFDRNFLRHQIFPLLQKRYPAYPTTLLRASQHLAEASHLLDELAELDYLKCMIDGKLQIEYLRQLNLPRAKNLLRYTFSRERIIQPGAKKLTDILQQLLTVSADTKLHISFGNTDIRCYKGAVNILPKRNFSENKLLIIWSKENRIELNQIDGAISFSYKNTGISLEKLNKNLVTIQLRSGGERFRPDCKRPRRRLKTLFQEALIPSWRRHALPLLFSGEQLVWVPGIGIDCDFQTKPGEIGLLPTWEPN